MKVTVLGAHNCESLATRLTTLLIDDLIAIDAGALTTTLSIPAQRSLRALFITHQHYDHIKDVPTLAFNFAMAWKTIDIYSTPPVLAALKLIFDNRLYPNFFEFPNDRPSINFTTLEPYQVTETSGYRVLPLPVNHSTDTVGYQITAPDGHTVFYTGDTGPGLAHLWPVVSPELFITEVSASDRFREIYERRRHLTPSLLRQELASLKEAKGKLPQVLIIHTNPELEAETAAEIAAVARDLGHPIRIGYEGMQIDLG
jgi:phosphoribosyl 1,2-cyclic phosphodiesterase